MTAMLENARVVRMVVGTTAAGGVAASALYARAMHRSGVQDGKRELSRAAANPSTSSQEHLEKFYEGAGVKGYAGFGVVLLGSIVGVLTIAPKNPAARAAFGAAALGVATLAVGTMAKASGARGVLEDQYWHSQPR